MVDECDQATTSCSTALMNTENDENGTVDYTHASVSSLSPDSDSGTFLFFLTTSMYVIFYFFSRWCSVGFLLRIKFILYFITI